MLKALEVTSQQGRSMMTTIAMPNGMGTPEDQLEITRVTADDYLRPIELAPSKFQIAVQQMHSMQDWTIQHRLHELGCTDANDFRTRLYMAEPRLKVIRDCANATKHAGKLGRTTNPILMKVDHVGDFSREFHRRDFDTNRLEAQIRPGMLQHDEVRRRDGGDFLDLDEALEECLAFWELLYQDKNILVPTLQSEEGQPTYETDTQVILPDEINNTTEQLAIAEHQTDAAANAGTPARAYLAATSIAPLEHWGYEDLKGPMEFPTNRHFRRYLLTEAPYIGPIWELAYAAKSGVNVVSATGHLVIALKSGESVEAIDTFRRAITFWRGILAEYTGYRKD